MGNAGERGDWLICLGAQPSFSTNLSPHSVDMNDAPENSLTIEPFAPEAPVSRPRRRRPAVPLDPRRSPGDLAVEREAETEPAEPAARTGHAVSIAGGVAVLRGALRNVPGGPGV